MKNNQNITLFGTGVEGKGGECVQRDTEGTRGDGKQESSSDYDKVISLIFCSSCCAAPSSCSGTVGSSLIFHGCTPRTGRLSMIWKNTRRRRSDGAQLEGGDDWGEAWEKGPGVRTHSGFISAPVKTCENKTHSHTHTISSCFPQQWPWMLLLCPVVLHWLDIPYFNPRAPPEKMLKMTFNTDTGPPAAFVRSDCGCVCQWNTQSSKMVSGLFDGWWTVLSPHLRFMLNTLHITSQLPWNMSVKMSGLCTDYGNIFIISLYLYTSYIHIKPVI